MENQGSNKFQNSLFGCLGDTRMCILVFCIPCYVVGKNAEVLGEDCLLIGLLSGLGLPFGPLLRWRIRQQKYIEGNMISDVFTWICCPCCALAQEARELGWYDDDGGLPVIEGMARK